METINTGLIGGALIGLAALLYLVLYGRVLGVSGLINQVFFNTSNDSASNKNRIWFILIGTLIGGSLYAVFFEPQFSMPTNRSPLLIIIAGLLVGFGTRMGNGCTSGHGVCGISRGSVRSIVATLTFMLSAIITVYISTRIFALGA
ncbi:hypothetical protein A9Q77_09940 [Marinomonas sp. 42_23_T18]|nr:hypothetical protein A9Q77_09940 [Marinomonas sp. 42_23_T18]